MPYNLYIEPGCAREIEGFCAKNRTLRDALDKKVIQVLEFPQRFKPLRAPMQNKRRVHVLKSFVLTYSIDEATRTVKLLAFTHHDEAYR